jgi:hypothetical protein
MSQTEIIEIAMPDGTVINAEVSVPDSIADVGARGRLNLGEARQTITSFVKWAVSGLGLPAGDGAGPPGEAESAAPPGMALGRVELEFGLKLMVKGGMLSSVIAAVGGEATAVVRLEWAPMNGSGQ